MRRSWSMLAFVLILIGLVSGALPMRPAQAIEARQAARAMPFGVQVQRAGGGAGAVVGSQAGVPSAINCGNECFASFASGETETLVATAGSGAIFVGWSGACSGRGACSLDIEDAYPDPDSSGVAVVTATFALAAAPVFLPMLQRPID